MTPFERSRAELPKDIRKALEESNLPIEVATAIADVCEQRAEVATPNEVWAVQNRTTCLLFESAEMARAYVAQFGVSIGLTVQSIPVFRAPPVNGER